MAFLVNPALPSLCQDDFRAYLRILELMQVLLKMLLRHRVSRACKKNREVKYRTKIKK